MSPHLAAYTASGIARKCVDLPGLWHCPIARLPENRVDLPGRTNNFNGLQIVATRKKLRGPEDLRRRSRETTRAR